MAMLFSNTDTLVITDSICQNIETDRYEEKAKLLKFPDKSVGFILKLATDSNYRWFQKLISNKNIKFIIINATTVDLMEILQSSPSYNSIPHYKFTNIINTYKILLSKISLLNKNALLTINSIIPLPKFQNSLPVIEGFNCLIEILAYETPKCVLADCHQVMINKKTGKPALSLSIRTIVCIQIRKVM